MHRSMRCHLLDEQWDGVLSLRDARELDQQQQDLSAINGSTSAEASPPSYEPSRAGNWRLGEAADLYLLPG